MDKKTQKELEDESFLQLEQEMKELSDKADDMFWFNFLEQNKKQPVKESDNSWFDKSMIERKKSSKWNWYEILLIFLFIILSILSIYFKWQFYNVAIWLFIIFFLSWFSSKTDIPDRVHSTWFNPFFSIFYRVWFYKRNWLYSALIILNIIFVIIYSPIFMSKLSLLWFIVLPLFFCIGPVWLYVCRFLIEIIKFINRAIKWEVDRKKVFKEVLVVIIIWVLARISIKYDIHWLIENWSQDFPFLKIFL